jgi:hypothetical protein
MSFPLQFLLVTCALFLVDVCWARYIAKVGEGKALPAATWSALIMLCGAFATISYLHDRRLLAAAILGAFLGTYTSVRLGKR